MINNIVIGLLGIFMGIIAISKKDLYMGIVAAIIFVFGLVTTLYYLRRRRKNV